LSMAIMAPVVLTEFLPLSFFFLVSSSNNILSGSQGIKGKTMGLSNF
jgi:hypothetical protein